MFRRLVLWVAPHLVAIGQGRAPDFEVGKDDPGGVYLRRWWLIPRNPVFNIYLHLFLRSDDDRALHDHMYVNLSVLLSGAYTEHTIRAGGVNRRTVRRAGEIKMRLPWSAHRVEVAEGASCWTLFVTGPRIRKWGFHCPEAGWVPHDVFTASGNPGEVGQGCGDGRVFVGVDLSAGPDLTVEVTQRHGARPRFAFRNEDLPK